MKKLIFILLVIVSLVGCENKSKIEIIPNYEAKYYSFEMVESIAVPLQQKNPKPISFEKYIKEIHQKENPNEKVYYLISVRYFINEDGKIEKIGVIKSPVASTVMRKMRGNGIINVNTEQIIEMALPELEKLEFKPAMLWGENVKVRADVQTIYVAEANGEVRVAENGIEFFKQKSDFEIDKLNQDIYFVAVEQMPEPIGGIGAIQKSIVYPEIAKRAGVEGRVFVKAFIDSTGTVAKTELIRGIGTGCDEAAMAAVKKIKFKPGVQRGKPVNVQVTVPILFKLGDDTDNSIIHEVRDQFLVRSMKDISHGGLGKLQGKVVTAKEGIPIVATNILLVGTKFGCASDNNGNFSISKIPPGKYLLQVFNPAYGKHDMGNVYLIANKSKFIEIQIKKGS